MNLVDTLKSLASRFLPKSHGASGDFSRMDAQVAQQNQEKRQQQQQNLLATMPDFRPFAARQPLPLFIDGKPNFDAAVKAFDQGYKVVGDWLRPQIEEMTTLGQNARAQGIYGAMPGPNMQQKRDFEAKLDSFRPLGIPVGPVLKFFNTESDETTLAREKLMRGETISQNEKRLLEQQQMDLVMGMSSPLKSASLEGAAPKVGRLLPEAKDKLRYLVRGVDDLVKGQGMTEKAAQSVKFPQYQKLMSGNAADDFIRSLEITPKQKVNIIDYLRTPDRVLEKIGLKPQMQSLRTGYDSYLRELPDEIQKITKWSQQVPESNERIFRWLDGEKIVLDPTETKVATEIKAHLGTWAERLGLPKDKRISHYITHIFEDADKEFDPDFAKLIRNEVAGSVYDPFLQQRKGAEGYLRDTWRALDAYTKRAVRKANLDPALNQIKSMAEGLETSQFNYVKSYVDRINLRPTDLDNLMDNFIKSTPVGYKFGPRPTTVLTSQARQMVYRGMLGLNFRSAIGNLIQGTNTYAELGEKYTAIGYSKVVQNLPKILSGGRTELDDVGVLGQDLIQDRLPSATKQFMQTVNKGLFYLFETAEKVNRGAAYWGAKSRAIASGMSEEEAIKAAKEIVGKTQFRFGSIDTPVALSSDIMKTLFQLQMFNVKQAEFLGEMAKNKNYVGLVRWIGSSLFLVGTIGKAFGMEPKDLIPSVRIGVPPTLQLPYGAYKAAIQSTDQYGNPLTPTERILNKDVTRGALNYVPAGSQLRKTIEGIGAVSQGGSYTETGRLRYPVELGLQPILFGPNVSQNAKEYFKDGSPLGDRQTKLYQSLIGSGLEPTVAYNAIAAQRETEKPEQRQGLVGKVVAIFNGLFSPKAEEQLGEVASDPLMKAWKAQANDSERVKNIKEIFDLGLSRTQTEDALGKYGISYEDAATEIAQSLGVENGVRGSYIKEILKTTKGDEYEKMLWYLAENEILTTAVLNKWLDDGEITPGVKKHMAAIISATKGVPAKKVNYTITIPKFSLKQAPSARIRVIQPKIDMEAATFKANIRRIQPKMYSSGLNP